jgi:UDP-N-acetylglucosamine:LPS N-acetylglucosamine transferase
MVEAGAAVRLGDAELTGASLMATITALDDERLRAMARASAAAGRRDAAKRVLAILHEVSRK